MRGLKARYHELPVHAHAPQGAMARLVAIQGDAVGLPMMLQCLAKEGLRRRNAACSTQIELHGVALSIHGSYRYIHWPRTLINVSSTRQLPSHRPLESVPALFAGFGIANHPAQDRSDAKSVNPARLKSRPDPGNCSLTCENTSEGSEENDVVFELNVRQIEDSVQFCDAPYPIIAQSLRCLHQNLPDDLVTVCPTTCCRRSSTTGWWASGLPCQSSDRTEAKNSKMVEAWRYPALFWKVRHPLNAFADVLWHFDRYEIHGVTDISDCFSDTLTS